MALQKQYLSTASLALFSKGFNVVSTFGILWLQNAVMDKADFGLFMMAFSLAFALSMVISAGFQSLILYHVSRKNDQEPAFIAPIAGQAFWSSVALGIIIAGVVYAGAPAFSSLIGETGLAPWMRDMAFFIPVNTAALVLPSYSRARQRVKETLFFQEIFLNILRVGFIALIWLLALPETFVSAAYIASALIPVLFLFWLAPIWPSLKDNILTPWDWAYAAKSTAFQVLNQPFRGLDIVLVGAFSSASIAADYAMAVRLAQLLWIPKHAAAQLQVPRMGSLLEKGDKTQLELEFNAMRSFSLIAVIGACVFLLLFGAPVLALFGDYQSALPALYILAAASIVRTGFGASGDLVQMAGHAGSSARIAGISMILTVLGTLILVPPFGALGGAYAVLLGTLQLFSGFIRTLGRKENLHLMPRLMWFMNAAGMALLALPAHLHGLSLLCGLLMAALAVIVTVMDKSWLRLIKHVS